MRSVPLSGSKLDLRPTVETRDEWLVGASIICTAGLASSPLTTRDMYSTVNSQTLLGVIHCRLHHQSGPTCPTSSSISIFRNLFNRQRDYTVSIISWVFDIDHDHNLVMIIPPWSSSFYEYIYIINSESIASSHLSFYKKSVRLKIDIKWSSYLHL